MQELINAMLSIILRDANWQKPIKFSVKRWNDLFVEFHSGYIFEFMDWYITITNLETQKKVRVRNWIDAKLSPDVLDTLKDWLNLDFDAWISIKEESEEEIEDEEIEDEEAWTEDDWGSEEATETEPQQEEKKEVKRQIPSSWAKKK